MDMLTLVLNGMAGIDSSLMDQVLRCLSGVCPTCHVEVLVLCGLVALIFGWKMELLPVKCMALTMICTDAIYLTQYKSKFVLEIIMSTNLPTLSIPLLVQVHLVIVIYDILVMNCIDSIHIIILNIFK